MSFFRICKWLYSEIYSVHGYIFDRVEEKLRKFERRLYPHTTKFKFVKNHDEKNTSSLKTKTKAYGKEKELEEFSKFLTKFSYEILYPKIKKYILKKFTNKTYRVIDKKETFNNFHLFLFSDNKALRNCKFDSFLNDFNKLKGDIVDLKSIEKKFYKFSVKYLMSNFKYKEK